jgi:hypothetical protein
MLALHSANMDLYNMRRFAGCWYIIENDRRYQSMPQVGLKAHTTIMSFTSRTVLTQTFLNPSKEKSIDQVSYNFPLYDGVSVVGFKCRVGSRTIYGLVKEKEQARADYKEAVSRGETAGLLEQLPESSDVFTTTIGNVPAGEVVTVEITYLGELKHDAEADGVRFTIPTVIAPRYGSLSDGQGSLPRDTAAAHGKGIEITVDVAVDEGAMIRSIQSPSHPIGVTLGRTSAMDEDAADPHRASATLSLGSAELEKDFVLLVIFKDQDIPRALLEHHPKYPNQRALMATLVPSFKLAPSRPEIVFVVDRSGSMAGKMQTVISALRIFLKSLPVGVKFNICSFGSDHSFLWKRSKSYDQSSLNQALKHVETFSSNFGGTEMFNPVKDTVDRRYKDMNLEVMILTDGEIWNQQQLFDFINESAAREAARFFSLGIGASVSHSLLEGIARAGKGFAQSVGAAEKLDKKVVKMLKGALTPHVSDYTLEIKYENSDEDFELIERVTDSLSVLVVDAPQEKSDKPISLFNPAAKKENDKEEASIDKTGEKRYSHLPTVSAPKLLQAPHSIPPLFPFIRTAAYLLISPEASSRTPKSVVLRATSAQGPLELEIVVQDIGKGQTIHQLAAKKAVGELEEGRGWIFDAKDDSGKKLKDRYDGRFEELVEREAVRLGVRFQVGGKFCSFVAVEKNKAEAEHDHVAPEDEMTGGNDEGWENLGEMGEGNVMRGAGHDAVDVVDSVRTTFGGNPVPMASRRVYGPRLTDAATLHARSPLGSVSRSRGRRGGFQSFHAAKSIQAAPQMSIQMPMQQMMQQSAVTQNAYPHQDEKERNRDHDTSMPLDACRRPSVAASAAPAPKAQIRKRRKAADYNTYAAPVAHSRQSIIMADEELDEDMGFGLVDGDEVHEDRRQKAPRKVDSDYDRMQALIVLQTFVGSWDWNDELFHALGIEKADVKIGAGGEDAEGVMATLLAVAFLETKLKGEMEVWELVVEKARGWLENEVGSQALISKRIKETGAKYFGGK